MSEENVELARRMVGWLNSRDPDAAQAHSTEGVEILPLRGAMEGTRYRGPTAFREFMADSDESWQELRFDAEEFRDAGDRVVAIGQLIARARLSGADVSMRFAIVFEFSDDRLSAARSYPDVDEALRAAGLANSAAGSRPD